MVKMGARGDFKGVGGVWGIRWGRVMGRGLKRNPGAPKV